MIYLFDKDEKLIKVVRKPAIKTALQKYSLTKERYVSDRLTVEMKALNNDELEKVEYMAIQTMEDAHKFHYFYVAQKSSENLTTLIGVQSGIEELRKSPVFDKRPQTAFAREVINDLLSGTNWQARFVGETTPHSTNFYYISVFDALKKVCEVWDLEMQFFVEMNGNRIGARYIDFKQKIGQAVGKRVVYGHNALQILQEVERTNIFTALVGRGKGEQVSSAEDSGKQANGFGRKITFEDVVWSTASGRPVNKPKGQKYVELPAMTKLYGIKNADGSMRPKIGFVDFAEEENPEQLLERTYKALINAARPQLALKTSSVYLRGAKIGDTIRVVRHDKRLDYDTRIFDITFNRLNDQSSDIKLGDRIGESNEAKAQTIAGKAIDEFVANEFTNFVKNLPDYLPTADGFNNNWYGSEDPTGKHPGKVLINDIWYKPDPEHEGHKIMLRWTGEVWEELLRTFSSEALRAKISDEIEKLNKAMKASDLTLKEQTAQALRTAGANSSAIEAAKGAITKLNQDLAGAKQTNQAAIDHLKSDFASAQKAANDQTSLLKSDLANIRTQQTVYEQTNSQNMSRIVGQIDDKASKSEVNQTADRIREEIASLSVGENLFINSEFKNLRDSGQRYTANGKTYQNMIAPYWYNPYNAGLPNAQNIQHGYFDTETSSETVFAFNESDGSRHWKALSTDFKIGVITSGEYYFSADLYATGLGTYIVVGFHYHDASGRMNFYSGRKRIDVNEKGRWIRLGIDLKVNDDIDFTKKVQFYVYGYNFSTNSILYLKKPKVSKGRLKSDWSPALEDTEGLITEAKATFERTAQGLRMDLSAVQAYVNAGGTRSEALRTYSREETARQLSALRQSVEAGYVAKAQHAEDVRSISRRFEELTVGGRNLMGAFNTKPVRSIFDRETYKFTAKTTQNTTRPTLILQFRWTDGSYSAVITISETGRFSRKFKITKPYSELRIKFNCNKEDAVLLFTGEQFIELNTDYYFTGDLINLSPNDSQADFLKIEKATITSDWSPAPEDAKNYADTKLAEYKQDINGQLASVQAALNTANGSLTSFNNWKQSAQETLNKVGRVETGFNETKTSLAEFKRTAEGQLTTITQQVAGKASQSDFQKVQETSKLYERLIGSTEKEITDKVSRMALTNELFQVEVSRNLGLRTVQYQMANAWAVQNLNSNGDIVSQINATGPNVRIQGESIHLDGKALIDNGIIKNAMIESMLADKITAGTLNAANVNIINLNANKIVGLDANFIKSKIELAFIEWMKGKVISAQNDAMQIDLNNGQYNVMTDKAAIRRVLNGYPNQFLKFTSETEGGAPASVTVLGANRDGTENSKNDSFAGIRLFSGNKVERTEIISDVVRFATGAVNYRGWEMRTLYGNDNRQVILQPFGNVTRSNIVANYFNGIDLVNVLETLNQMMANLGNHTGRHDIFGPIRGLGARKYVR